jgi:hypothetical protein
MSEDPLAVGIHNLLLYGDLIRALTALATAGVPVIVLKGAALADTIYPSLADRPMNDVDLLVQPHDRDRARAALEGAGYRFLPEPQQRFGPFDTGFTGEMQFRRSEHNVIELHWELTANEWLRRLTALDAAALWRDARPFAIGPARGLQLSPCDTLQHLCLHLSAHGYTHANGWRDIRQLLAHERSFPWERFVARARQFRLTAVCYFVLEAIASASSSIGPENRPPTPQPPPCEGRGAVLPPLLAGEGGQGGEVPPAVLAALRPSPWQRRLVPLIADPRQGLAGELTHSKPRGYLLHLALADRLADLLRVLVWLFFPGLRWLAERYRLRGRWRAWLACLWHPGVVLAQGLAGLWALASPRPFAFSPRAGVSYGHSLTDDPTL